MPKTHTFIVNDESVLNDYGFRVMTAGIDIKQYKRNPIVLWYHKRPNQWNNDKEDLLPIGKSIKLWKEDGKLLADIEFDEKDEFANKIESKIDGGFIRMCSPGLNPVTVSEEARYLLSGQTRSTLVKSELIEISIADIGSNQNALKLYNDNMEVITLSKGGDNDTVPLLSKQQKSETKNNFKMKKIAIKLGLDPEASEDSILRVLETKIELASKVETYKASMEAMKVEVDKQKENEIITLVSTNVDKKFTADKKEHFVTLGKTAGIEVLKSTFEAMGDITGKPTDVTGQSPGSGKNADDDEMTFKTLVSKGNDFVEQYKKENRADYIKLFKAEYGEEPNFDYER